LFNTQIFNEDKIVIPDEADVVFVSDAFTADFLGGAELTTDALIDASPFETFRLHSKDVNMELLSQGVDRIWIFGNFSNLDSNLIPSIVGNLSYSIVEYDYKYCKYRSPEKHQAAENIPCDCHDQMNGKLVSAFYYGATSLWWMSEKQMELYHGKFPFLKDKNNTVLSSVFDEEFFSYIKHLNERKDTERKGHVIVGSTSWIKGVPDSEEFCKKNNLEYEVVWNLPYKELLDKLSSAESLVFLPRGSDTCPRLVIEAKLLGCDLNINENVQHAKELWFDTDNLLDTLSYLYAARSRFWNGIKHSIGFNPSVSGYTTTFNCVKQNYPFEASINSLLGFCDEVVVVDGGSDDGTWEKLKTLSEENENLVIHQESRDWDHPRFAVFDGMQKALARSLCTKNYCWQQDSDEIVHEDDYDKIKSLVKNFPKNIELIALPVIEYWGGPDKVRLDINPWKWRVSRNLPHITHGIPANLRKHDAEGNLYSLPGSDGCDYIRNDSYQPIRFASFYTPDVDKVRQMSFANNEALNEYQKWFNHIVGQYPGVHHYSWFDIERKIKTYRDYWSTHWQSLYDIEQNDIPENNMFFDSAWSDVTEDQITEMANKLSEEMGGWVFHTKVDFEKATPHVEIERPHPATIMNWLENLGK